MGHITKPNTFTQQTKILSAQVNTNFDVLYNQSNTHDDQIGILSNSKYEVVNVKTQFGAKGDGVSSDTTAIQAAIDSIGTNGGIIFLPIGTYMVDYLSLPSNCILLGAGKKTVLKQIAGALADHHIFSNKNFVTGDKNIVVKDLLIDGNKAAQTVLNAHYGFYFGNMDGVLIENVEIKDMEGNGVFLGYSWAFGNTSETPAKNVTVKDCKITGCSQNQIAVLYVDGVIIENCYIQGASSSALVDLENHHANDYIKNVTVTKCRLITDAGGQRTKVQSNGVAAANENVKFDKNTFINHGISVTQFGEVEITNNKFKLLSTNVGVELDGATDITVAGNRIFNGNIGIYAITYSTINPSDLRIKGNKVYGCANQGIYIQNAADVLIEGNTVLNNGSSGIYLVGTTSIFTVIDNLITDTRPTGKTQSIGIATDAAVGSGIISSNYMMGNGSGATSYGDTSKFIFRDNWDGTRHRLNLWAPNNNTYKYAYMLDDNSFNWDNQVNCGGGIILPVLSVTAATNLTITNNTVLANASTAAFTVTLPNATTMQGKIFIIKKIDSSANVVTIATTSSQTIDGATTKTLTTQYQLIRVQSDGANWQTI